MKQYVINEDLAQAVANYLSTRPYREVAGLMAGLGQLRPVQDPEENSQAPADNEN